MNASAFSSERTPVLARLASPNWDLLCRSVLVAVLVILVHQFQWTGLRFATSEAILRMSALLGMGTARLSFDTIRVQTEFFQFVTACTFIDVFAGSIPLLWDLRQSLFGNFCRLAATVVLLSGFNLLRLELGQILHAHHVPWTLAEDVLGGAAYFVVWIVLWRFRGGRSASGAGGWPSSQSVFPCLAKAARPGPSRRDLRTNPPEVIPDSV